MIYEASVGRRWVGRDGRSSLTPSNLGYAEPTKPVGPPLGSGPAVGTKVAIFGRDLDPDGRIGAAFTTALVDAA